MTDINRRKFVSLVGAGAAAVPLSALVASLPSKVQADNHAAVVDPESTQAKALQYVSESEKPDQNCLNCTLYTGAEGEEAGGCPLFPGQNVMAVGWCSAWVPKA